MIDPFAVYQCLGRNVVDLFKCRPDPLRIAVGLGDDVQADQPQIRLGDTVLLALIIESRHPGEHGQVTAGVVIGGEDAPARFDLDDAPGELDVVGFGNDVGVIEVVAHDVVVGGLVGRNVVIGRVFA